MKKRLFFLITLIFCFILAACVLSACNESDISAFYGTYESLWGVGDITIDENGASTPETNAPVSVSDGKLTIEYDRIPWVMTPYENNDVLVLGEPSRFDENNIRTRSGYFSGHLVNFSGTGVSEQFSFSADGSYSYIDVSSGGYMQHSGSYKLQDGVLCMRGVTWGGSSVRCGYYITENYEFYMNVYVRNLDRFTPPPPDPVIEYITTDAERGEIQGDTHQQLGEGETGTPVTAVAHEGYIFTQWSDGRTDNPRTDSNLEESDMIFAEFEPVYDIVFDTEEGGVIVSGETQQQIIGDGVTSPVTVEVQPGYRFLGWDRMEDDSALTAEIDTSVFNLQWHTGEPYRIVARFEKIVYTAIYDSEQGGYLNGTEKLLTYEVDYEDGYTTPAVTATPITETDGSGYYVFVGWSDGVKEATRKDVMTEDIRVVAQFEHYFTVTFTAERGGHIEGDLEQHLTGDDFTATTVTAIPDDGWAFDGWWARNWSIATYDPSITHHKGDNAMNGDAEYTARFRWLGNTYDFNYGMSTDGGSLRGDTWQGGIIEGEYGTPVEAVPDEGYVFVRWSDGRTDNPRTDVATSNLFVNAIFVREEMMRQFTLTYTAGTGGSITGETLQTVLYGESGTAVTAVPDEGYEFVRWSDGVTTVTRTDSNVTSDVNVTAEFRRIELTLAYTAGIGGSITGETLQTVFYGESGTDVTAVPDECYEFVRWADGVTTATRTDSNITSDITVTAEFRLIGDTTDFAGGIGTADCPYEIETVEHLQNMELYPNAHFTLTADIVLSEVGEGESNFAPLFSDETMFGGTLDGQGHKITNLTVYNTETFYSGLFSCISASGSVTNLTLENASVSGTNYIGGIAGYALGAMTDCTVAGSITYVGDNSYKVFVGGIAGRAEASVDGCVTDVTITVDNAQAETNVGGMVGYLAYSGSSSAPLKLTSYGSITVSSSGNVYAGGLVGYSSGGLYLSVSYATGDVTSTGGSYSHVGGFVGYGSSTITITDSYATGNVTSTGTSGSSYAGGLVGNIGSAITITDSYATGNVTSTSSYSYAGGLVGDGSSTITDSYATGNVTSTGNYSSVGGLVGSGNSITVRNSYSVSCVSAETERGDVYLGGLAGYVYYSPTLENAHWYGGEGTAAEYAVGYSDSLGIPTSIGSTRHNALEEFYTLADTLNAGREEPVWEHKGEGTLPTLIEKTQENEEETL